MVATPRQESHWRPLVEAAAARFSIWNRRQKLSHITRFLRATNAKSVLLVGVTPSAEPWANIVERGLEAIVPVVVASGLETDSPYPWAAYVACDGLKLPFPDKSFDVVISNAVIEHVGDSAAQATFVDEHDRVGRSWLLTTPNRWFPVESHTRTMFCHWSSSWRARQTSFTRLLSQREFKAILPWPWAVRGGFLSPTFLARSDDPIARTRDDRL